MKILLLFLFIFIVTDSFLLIIISCNLNPNLHLKSFFSPLQFFIILDMRSLRIYTKVAVELWSNSFLHLLYFLIWSFVGFLVLKIPRIYFLTKSDIFLTPIPSCTSYILTPKNFLLLTLFVQTLAFVYFSTIISTILYIHKKKKNFLLMA